MENINKMVGAIEVLLMKEMLSECQEELEKQYINFARTSLKSSGIRKFEQKFRKFLEFYENLPNVEIYLQ